MAAPQKRLVVPVHISLQKINKINLRQVQQGNIPFAYFSKHAGKDLRVTLSYIY